ncbi:hypothetical protein Natpe_4042 (plasmid) [Natrinema pellirubrum DSM 15624]|jgi:hypothetical protein|uniref:PIN domain-containing protein n=1 Tax=Natrinema pellirubrum (strain DSM 15624 / CIP 106293 / JCM 10476 / NCIMB 786 / 157) TaxID=797303 RepID=L0JR93_NATP1|nr:hypothetical protein [Natrinema pellirubrum]AGB33769.1 hypothetical protein Natpe_4042 [Natrinema pellirubrum DSM 15624]
MDADREIVFLDSSVLISCGRRGSGRFQALAREAKQRDVVFRISPQVYAEVSGETAIDGYESSDLAVDEALREGWLKVTESPSYSISEVSKIMDQSRRFIATASDRPEDIVEKADTEIIGLSLQMLIDGTADQVTVVTNDIPLGEATEALIPKYGFAADQVAWLTGGDLAPELDEDFVPEFE